MLDQTVELFNIMNPGVEIDRTGHSTDQASMYYARKIKKQSKKWRKHYAKNKIAIDTQTQVILAQRVVRGPRHDSKDAIATIRKTDKYKPIAFSLDKVFDSEYVHRVIHEELEASIMILPKKKS